MKRAELHQAVWANPAFHVAKRLGISYRGLSLTCKRMEIPTPPRGYWRKVKTGQSPNATPLPAPESNPEVQFDGPVADGGLMKSDIGGGQSTDCGHSKLPPAARTVLVWPSPAPEQPDIFHVNAAIKAEHERASEIAAALGKHRAVDLLLSDMEGLAGIESSSVAAVLAQWANVVRRQQALTNPVGLLLAEFRTIAGSAERPHWWSAGK